MAKCSASGTAVRFEPGQQRTVELVAVEGNREVYGFAGQVDGMVQRIAGVRSAWRGQVLGAPLQRVRARRELRGAT